jgi:hypothetical protein
MEKWVSILLLVIQQALFVLARLMDDISWHDVGIPSEVNVCEGIGVAAMALCGILKLVRKWHIEGIMKILFVKSQIKFIIPWALDILIVILFFSIFGCHHESTENEYFFVLYDGCVLNTVQILLTNLNYSLICNTKADTAELAVYLLTLFGEVIYNGNLMLMFINHLEEKPKDYSILYVSIVIANQVLIMDLLFRAAFEDKEREQKFAVDEASEREQVGMLRAEVLDGTAASKMELASPTKK